VKNRICHQTGLLLVTLLIGSLSILRLETVIRAQQSINTAILSGFVEDKDGATVRGATVRLTAIERNQTLLVVTDEVGRFRFSYLPVGTYKLVIVATGFATREQTLTLTVGQSLSLTINLLLAEVASGVEIVSDPPVVEVVRTQVAETILPREIEALPLNGRNYLDLAALTPGVTRGNPVANQRFAETSAVPGTQINIAGQRNINNGFVIDGLSANDDAADLPGTFLSQEVIGQFQVIVSGGIAEFGRASGGIVNIVTKSGSNDWHGRVYGFLVNQHLNARNPLANARTPLTQAQYGASLGGPLRRDKGFFFSNFERTSLRSTTVLTITPVNVTAINSILDQLAYRGPRVSTGLAPTGYDANTLFIRGDYRLNDRHLFNIRYSFYDIDSPNARGVGGLNAISRGTSLANRDQTVALSEVASLGSNIVNEARFLYTRSELSAPPNDLTGPAINISGVANLGTSTTSPTGRANDLLELVDNLTIQRATHSVKFGADFLFNRVDILFPGALQGIYTFSSLANLQAGRYATYQQAFGRPSLLQSNPNLGLFLQDEWRVWRGLTLNAGLRYDQQDLPNPIETDRNNFAPRIGLAYAPGTGRTVLRASYGLFFDRIPLRTTSNALQRDGKNYKVAAFAFGQEGAPKFPDVAAAFPTSFLPTITTIDPQISNAYSIQTSLQIERELTSATSISVGYIRTRGLHLVLARNVNVPTLTAAEAARQGVANLGRPNPNFGNISRYESSGDSWYNGMTVSLNRRFRGWAGMRVSYTYSQALDNTGSAFFFTPQNNFNLRDDRGRSDNDQRHVIAIGGAFAVPENTGRSLLGVLINGMQLNPIFRYSSALPFNILTGSDRNNDTNVNDRPIGVGRNTGRGFNFASLDTRLSRRIRLTESIGLEVVAEAFNLLNRANLQLPVAIWGTGVSPNANFGQPNSAADPRQFQFGLRLNF